MPDAGACLRTRARCRNALEHHDALRPLWRAWRSGDAVLAEARSLLPAVRSQGLAMSRLVRLKHMLSQAGMPVGGGAFEHFLIVAAAGEATGRLDGLPIDDRVTQLFLDTFERYADARVPEPFDLTRPSFIAMSRIATVSRYPAGQLDWEVSGVPRSWIFRAKLYAFPRLIRAVAGELRGLGPVFFSHLNPTRRNEGSFLERESLRSYHRMARSMERQPGIRGLVTASWLHPSDTFAVSPHAAWLNDVFQQNGGYIVPLGRLDDEAGTFVPTGVPTQALVIWPRAAMLDWARRHEEFRDASPARHRARPPQRVAV